MVKMIVKKNQISIAPNILCFFGVENPEYKIECQNHELKITGAALRV